MVEHGVLTDRPITKSGVADSERIQPSAKDIQEYISGNKEKREIDLSGPDWERGNDGRLKATDKREKMYQWANDALNGPERPEPKDLTDGERQIADRLAKLAKEYYDHVSGAYDPKSGQDFDAMKKEFRDMDKETARRVIDATNVRLKDTGLRFAEVPGSGEVWLGRKNSAGYYGIGAGVRDQSR